jgi:hypothetical protein
MHYPSKLIILTPPPTISPTSYPSPRCRLRTLSLSPDSPHMNTPYCHPCRASQSPSQPGDKRRRTTRASQNVAAGPESSPRDPTSGHAADRFRPPPIKPIGFAASRESRRQEGGYGDPIPSPVVMGFDYKNVDAEQLKTVSHNLTRHSSQTGMPFAPLFVPPTPLAHHQMPPPLSFTRNQAEALQVRATLSIKEQQEALIAQRRREAAGEPIDPRGHSFKEWQTSADKPRSMPQPKSRQESGVHLSVNTSRHEDVIAASRVGNISSHQCLDADMPVCTYGITCGSAIRWTTWYDAPNADQKRTSRSHCRSSHRPHRTRSW